ncbi:molecular chaperone DnaK [Rubrivivax gelatinosus]|uniref:TraR/DksA family transcriptional regulator n=1 Tax=Rubrivivax gelatinosus TaxID=28068 RepID=A0A4R2M8Q9_RUBGE|nr:molecular chaperone DnaK [Rubrivivax gelatinosus]MBK1689489.1 molecular chaperone DnaK [Rubrivivax gelatinosus]TCP00817.1 hypothetical protein EV684_11121 [Rubrivivax gelatinosus]
MTDQLDRRLEEHHQGLSRAEHAHEMRDDHDELRQREDERDVDMALSDLELRELGEVSTALRRLKAEPWAQRCVACESRRERQPSR